MVTFTTTKIPPLDGRTIVIIGANGGVGRVAATVLAKKAARAVLAMRNEEKVRVAAAAGASFPLGSGRFDEVAGR